MRILVILGSGGYKRDLPRGRKCTQVGQPINGELMINNTNMIFNRVNLNGSLIGGIPETQEVIDYCAKHNIYPQITND